MSTQENKSLEEIYDEFNQFVDGFKSVVLATINKTNEPESSYAPVMKHDGKFYVYISELSNHTFNLLENPQASLLFIEPEGEAKHLFARKRATLKTRARHIKRSENEWESILGLFGEKFGKIIGMLKPMEDFHLFELTSGSAGYVSGFAQAYKLEGSDLSKVTHLTEGGHGKSKVKEKSRTKKIEEFTDSQHQELHKLVAAGNPFAARENFAIWVSVQYKFQQKISDLYRNPTLKEKLPDLEDRSRLPAAASDLKDLGKDVPEETILNSEDLSTAQVLGWLFVSEGSTLGAAVLRKKAAAELELSDEFGASHLAASPEGRGKHWKAFTALINELPMSEEEEHQMREAAHAAFSYFAEQLQEAYKL